MHFIVPLEILGGTVKEEFLLAAYGKGLAPPLPSDHPALPTEGRA